MIAGLPDRLRTQRQKYRMSQKVVADRLRISQSMIAGYESGYRTPSTEMLLALAYLYHCSTDYLLGKEKSSTIALLDVHGLTDDQVDAITRLVETMREHG